MESVRQLSKNLDLTMPGWAKRIKITWIDRPDSVYTQLGIEKPKGPLRTKAWKEEVTKRRRGRSGPKF